MLARDAWMMGQVSTFCRWEKGGTEGGEGWLVDEGGDSIAGRMLSDILAVY